MAQSSRITRRIVGMLSAREADLQLDAVDDKRAAHLIKWPLDVVLRIAIVCLSSGCSSLLQAEQRTVEMTPDIRHKLKILRRISDTTLRTILTGQAPDQIRNIIHRQIRAAARRKALLPDDLPFTAVAFGHPRVPHCTSLRSYSSVQRGDARRQEHGAAQL